MGTWGRGDVWLLSSEAVFALWYAKVSYTKLTQENAKQAYVRATAAAGNEGWRRGTGMVRGGGAYALVAQHGYAVHD